MTEESNNYSQFELFPDSSRKNQSSQSNKIGLKRIVFSFEQLIVCCLVLIVVLIGSFSIGVENGKKVRVRGGAGKINSLQSGVNDVISSPLEGQGNPQKIVVSMDPQREVVIEENIEILSLPEIGFQEEPKPQVVEVQQDGYTVQVASFKSVESAQKEASSLVTKGFEALVMDKGNYSIVCVGRFNERQEATKLSLKLKDRYKDCLVRRL